MTIPQYVLDNHAARAASRHQSERVAYYVREQALRDAEEAHDQAQHEAFHSGHARKTIALFAVISGKSKALILSNIANHYGITAAEAHAEVTHDEAESLLDYVTGPERAAVSVLMQKYRIK